MFTLKRCLSYGYGVNSYSSQFVLKSIRTHFGQCVLSFRSIRTHVVKERRALSSVFGPLRDKIMKVTIQHFLVAVLLDE